MARVNSDLIPDEKIWFTNERLKDFNRFPPDDRNTLLDLEMKFGNIGFLPLDIPIIKSEKHEEFIDWFFKNCKVSTKLKQDSASHYTGGNLFSTIDYIPGLKDDSNSIWSKNLFNDFDKLWPDLWEQFYEYFPFKKITGFSIWSSNQDIVPHRDHTLFLDLPLEFKILLHDPNPEPNLTIGESLPNSDLYETIQECSLPNHLNTNSFVWNNLRTKHFSKFKSEYKKMILLFHRENKFDWIKYKKLIEKSLILYKDKSLLSQKKIQDYVDVE